MNRPILLARVEFIALVLSFQALGAGPAQRGFPQMVDAGGYKVRAHIEGQGSPAVVFVAGGFGAPLESWGEVRTKTSRFTQTVAYDRGGTGKSEAAPPPRDSKHIASELHAVLNSAGIAPPYVLVGHSLGGLHIRVFAHMYPSEVAGIILIDPTSEDFEAEVKARDPQMWKNLEKQNQDTAEKIDHAPLGIRNEYEARDADLQEARDSGPLPEVPVVLFSSTHPKDPDITPMGRAIWLEQHEKLLRRVPGSKHIITDKSGHAIHWQEPDLIVDAIRGVVNTRIGHSR